MSYNLLFYYFVYSCKNDMSKHKKPLNNSGWIWRRDEQHLKRKELHLKWLLVKWKTWDEHQLWKSTLESKFCTCQRHIIHYTHIRQTTICTGQGATLDSLLFKSLSSSSYFIRHMSTFICSSLVTFVSFLFLFFFLPSLLANLASVMHAACHTKNHPPVMMLYYYYLLACPGVIRLLWSLLSFLLSFPLHLSVSWFSLVSSRGCNMLQ